MCRVVKIIKRNGYFAGLIDDESILILSTNGNEYCVSLFKENGEYEIYMYRLLSETEYKRYKKLKFGGRWRTETNNPSTAFAMVFSKTFSYLPSVNELTSTVISALKDVENK